MVAYLKFDQNNGQIGFKPESHSFCLQKVSCKELIYIALKYIALKYIALIISSESANFRCKNILEYELFNKKRKLRTYFIKKV